MRRLAGCVAWICWAIALSKAEVEELVIQSFSRDGAITWIYPTNGVVEYRIEGATDLIRRDWNDLGCWLAPTGNTMSAPVPLVYRVKAVTTILDDMAAIAGGLNTGTNPLAPLESYHEWYPKTYSHAVAAFHMDRHEVTKALWDEVYAWATGNGYSFSFPGSGKGTDHPVHTVNWYDCVKWCNARSQKEGRTPVYYTDAALTQTYKTGWQGIVVYVKESADGFRLPTDDQWQYAARAGLADKRFPWGDEIQHARANYYSTNSVSYDTSPTRGYHPDTSAPLPHTMRVGSLPANGYGLYDMTGNVQEWTGDTHASNASWRVVRGGAWNLNALAVRIGYQGVMEASSASYMTGFRTVVVADAD